jgi:hypothetical protein
MSVEKTNRRRSALGRLEAQLVSGKKHEKLNKKTTQTLVDLTDADKNRINKEIEKLRKY